MTETLLNHPPVVARSGSSQARPSSAPPVPVAVVMPAAASTLDGRHCWHGVEVVRELPNHRIARRFLARRAEDGSPLLLYRIGPWTTLADPASFVDRTFELRHLRAENICCIRDSAVASDRACWLLGGYPGHAQGLITLHDALNTREGGRLGRHEARIAIEQVLSASAAAHRVGIVHGPIAMDDLLLTPRGRVLIELYGLERSLRAGAERIDPRVLIASEVRSIARLAFLLLSGASWGEHGTPSPGNRSPDSAHRRLRRMVACRHWRDWLDAALINRSRASATAEAALATLREMARGQRVRNTSISDGWQRRVRVFRCGVIRSASGAAERSAERLRSAWSSRIAR